MFILYFKYTLNNIFFIIKDICSIIKLKAISKVVFVLKKLKIIFFICKNNNKILNYIISEDFIIYLIISKFKLNKQLLFKYLKVFFIKS